MVNINQLEDAVYLLLSELSVELLVPLEKLLILQFPVFVLIKLMENALKTSYLLFGDHLLHHHRHRGLLHFLSRIK